MIDIFHISKLIIKKKLKVLSDSDKSELKKFNKEYPFLKEIKFEELADKIESYSTINKERAWESIEQKSQNRKGSSVFVLFKKPWYKYAAAAIFIGILTTTYFLKGNIVNTPIEATPIIVNTNIIEPGTDKATLTLGDGTVVALEKGNNYQNQNIKSNGEELIYKAGKRKTNEVAYNYLTIPRGGQFFIKLSDGSQVWLNSESQLKYPVSFIEGETRVVELVYGEAYFDVSSSENHNGTKFKVLNRFQEIEVLGTEFNVKAYKDESNIYTTLVEGKVALGYNDRRQELTPNLQSNLNIIDNTITVAKVDIKSEISWKNGIFSFKDKPLRDIMKVISRWYDVDVVFQNKDLEEISFKGVLGKNQDLEQILLTIKTLSIIKNYEINEKTIKLE